MTAQYVCLHYDNDDNIVLHRPEDYQKWKAQTPDYHKWHVMNTSYIIASHNGNNIIFYTRSAFDDWKAQDSQHTLWTCSYYKGLR